MLNYSENKENLTRAHTHLSFGLTQNFSPQVYRPTGHLKEVLVSVSAHVNSSQNYYSTFSSNSTMASFSQIIRFV